MHYLVSIPQLRKHELVIKSSVFARPKLLLNGVPLKKVKGVYCLTSNSGKNLFIELKFDPMDMSVPKIVCNNEIITIVPPLGLSAKIYIFVPLILAALLVFSLFQTITDFWNKLTITSVAALIGLCWVYFSTHFARFRCNNTPFTGHSRNDRFMRLMYILLALCFIIQIHNHYVHIRLHIERVPHFCHGAKYGGRYLDYK
jgi:hypothetical protein